jgi:hypothetical protein
VSSRWTHLYCIECWDKFNPLRPVKDRSQFEGNMPEQPCCSCGGLTSSGIFVRASPDSLPCHGEGGAHADGQLPEAGGAA